MELADDIAYGVHDLEDAIALKLITREHWQRFKKIVILNGGMFKTLGTLRIIFSQAMMTVVHLGNRL